MVYSYSSSGVQRLFYAQGEIFFHAKRSDDLLFSNLQKSSPRPYGCPPPSKIVIYTKTFAQARPYKITCLMAFFSFLLIYTKKSFSHLSVFSVPFRMFPSWMPGAGAPFAPPLDATVFNKTKFNSLFKTYSHSKIMKLKELANSEFYSLNFV